MSQTTTKTQRPQEQEAALTPEYLEQVSNQSQASQQQSSDAVVKETYEMIVFNVSSQEYAVPITSVQEIILYQFPTRIPNAPAAIEGIINLRGKIIPVVNAYKRLGLKEALSSSDDANVSNKMKAASGIMVNDRIIILQVADQTVGIVVDAVSEVLQLNSDEIVAPPQQLAVNARFVTGIGKYQNRLLIMLDPSKLIFDKDGE